MRKAAIGLLIVWGALAQSPTGSKDAREIFFATTVKQDHVRKLTLPFSTAATPASGRPLNPKTPVSTREDGAPHLGIRYTLALVNVDSGATQPVNPERLFHPGECVAINIESNRSGYLYVLSKQSSGNWQPLLPSPDMPEESNVINPGEKVRVPKGYCFEIKDPPGTETLFVILSRDARDVQEFTRGIHGQGEPSAPRHPATENVQLADARLVASEVERIAHAMGSRDLVIRKVGGASSSREESPNTVYVVNASDVPALRVATRIEIRHK